MSTNPEVLEVLARAATGTKLVEVKLRDGRNFRDGVREVFSVCGAWCVIFHASNRMYVDDITCCAPVSRGADDVVL